MSLGVLFPHIYNKTLLLNNTYEQSRPLLLGKVESNLKYMRHCLIFFSFLNLLKRYTCLLVLLGKFTHSAPFSEAAKLKWQVMVCKGPVPPEEQLLRTH